MGRLFTDSGTFTLNPETTIATFESGSVYSPAGALGTGNKILIYYDEGRIYRSVTSPFGDGHPNVLARCDKFGRIESADGSRLGYCEQGSVKDRSGQTIAYYEGDIYGAAAAACAVFFGLGNSAQTEKPDDRASGQSGEATSTNDYSATSVIFSILGAVFIAVWKFIKTIPFWGPYGSILLLVSMMRVGPSSGSSSGGAGSVAGVFFLAYLILHTILLFKCKKWEAKHKYWPIYVGFVLLVTTLVAMCAVPAVAFQVGVLIYMKQQRKELR